MGVARGKGDSGGFRPLHQLEPIGVTFRGNNFALWGYSRPKIPEIFLRLSVQPKANQKFDFLPFFAEKTSIFGNNALR